jgi:hypothetical protein
VTFFEQYVAGRTVQLKEVDGCVKFLVDLWLASCHTSPDGGTGWYRRLPTTDRVGNVATAQAVGSLVAAGAAVPHIDAVLTTLVRNQRRDGGWPFVSNLANVAVVDSTASVVLALTSLRHTMPLSSIPPHTLLNALDWLERVALPEGGWGLIADSPLRPYSTALAVEALCAGGRNDAVAVHRAVQRLNEVADPATGGWHDSSRQLSIPTTARVIKALAAVGAHRPSYLTGLVRPGRWLLDVAQSSLLWSSGVAAAPHEEVEVRIDGSRVRVEYRHTPQAVTVQALVTAGYGRDARVCLAVRQMIRVYGSNDGKAAPRTSWMLHDLLIALISFREVFADAQELWIHRTRVVAHPHRRVRLVRLVINHRAKIVALGACFALAWLLVKGGLVSGFNVVLLCSVAGSVALNVVANFIYDMLTQRGGT